jgi:hypothetical protein
VLVREAEHAMLPQGTQDLPEMRWRKRLREIDTLDAGTQTFAACSDAHRFLNRH